MIREKSEHFGRGLEPGMPVITFVGNLAIVPLREKSCNRTFPLMETMPLYLVLNQILGAFSAEKWPIYPIFVFYGSFKQFKAVLSNFKEFPHFPEHFPVTLP